MKVSACIITYNHENYIRECLEGSINQINYYDYEIVISDDKSSDNTLQICLEYASKYPNLIRILPSESNLGMIGNWIKSISNCKGEYIALCEGDDYWTDPYKLQKQVDFLEENPSYVMSFHNRFLVDNFNKKLDFDDKYPYSKKILTQEEMICGSYAPTQTLVCLNAALKELPKNIRVFNVDTFLIAWLGQFGKAYFHEDIMPSAYRIHNGGIFSQIDNSIKVFHSFHTFLSIQKHIQPKYKDLLDDKIAIYAYNSISNGYYKTIDMEKPIILVLFKLCLKHPRLFKLFFRATLKYLHKLT